MLFHKWVWIGVGTDLSRPRRQSRRQEDVINRSLHLTYPHYFIKQDYRVHRRNSLRERPTLQVVLLPV